MNSEPSAVNSGLQVVGDFGRATTHLNRLKQWSGWLTTLSPALVAAGFVGWIVTLLLLWWGERQLATTFLVIVIVVSFIAVIVPQWMAGLSAEITQYTQLRTAQDHLTELLETYLNDNWTLYHQFPLGEKTVSLLIGTNGLYLLDLLFSTQAAQVKADKWLFRTEDDSWTLSKVSPTRKATQKAIQLQKQLSTDGTVFVQPRVVWAGDEVILLDEPSIPVWWLAQVEGMLKDLREEREGMSAETLTQIHVELEKIIEQTHSEAAFEL